MMLEKAADIDFFIVLTKKHQSGRHWLTFRIAVQILASAMRLPRARREAGLMSREAKVKHRFLET